MTTAEKVAAKIQEIVKRPDLLKHSFQQLQICCLVDGNLVLGVMDAHRKYASLGTNGGTRCDVTDGPCACGASH